MALGSILIQLSRSALNAPVPVWPSSAGGTDTCDDALNSGGGAIRTAAHKGASFLNSVVGWRSSLVNRHASDNRKGVSNGAILIDEFDIDSRTVEIENRESEK